MGEHRNEPSQTRQPALLAVAAIVHIYRGLMDRASTWRVRIDTPTNWAIITSGTAVSFTMSDATHSHAVLPLIMLFTLMFLTVEARRTRYYDLWSSWLRLLEIEYFAPIVRDNTVQANVAWQELLVRDLAFPHFKTTFWQMFGRRLRDNYLAIYLFLILSWLLKLLLHGRTDLDPMVADTFINHAALGPISGVAMLSGVFGFYTILLILVLVTYRTGEPSIEVLSHNRTLQKLVSPFQQPMHPRPWQPEHPVVLSGEERAGGVELED